MEKIEQSINVEGWDWNKLINKAFIPYVENKSSVLIHYGSRASSKSNFTAKRLIYLCLTQKYFKCILIRRVADTIRDSSYAQIKQAVQELGLDELFTFKVNPLEIECYNGGKFLCRGTDDPTKLKSIVDPSIIWVEEEVFETYEDFITIVGGLRGNKAEFLQCVFTINTDVDGDFEQWWFYKLFFTKYPNKLSYTDTITTTLPNGKVVNQDFTVHHSTFYDNRWIDDVYKAKMEAVKEHDPYKYTIDVLGLFARRQTGGLYYSRFSYPQHTLKNLEYKEDIALHVSFDFNRRPYCSATIWQVSGKTAWCIDEIATTEPNNNSVGVCKEFKRKYIRHYNGVYVYGDATGKREDTRSEAGTNDWSIIRKELSDYKPIFRVPNINPNMSRRGLFINEVFSSEYEGISIRISDKCRYLLQDFTFLKENSEGKKHKEKSNKGGVSIELFGHHSDTFDYFICECFKSEYLGHQRGNGEPQRLFGSKRFNSKLNY